jgi:hypothetical protein
MGNTFDLFFVTQVVGVTVVGKYTVTCIPFARQRLQKKHSPEAYACDNRTSIARQLRGKQASSTIQTVFSAWSVQSYKKCSAVKKSREQ